MERQISEYEKSSTHIFDKDNFELLKSKCVQKINENKEIIITQKHFPILIEIWKMFDENGFNSFKNDFINEEKNILLLFDTMVSVGKINTGITVSHYNAFNYKIMSYFGDLEEFKSKALKYKNDEEIYKVMSEGIVINYHFKDKHAIQ